MTSRQAIELHEAMLLQQSHLFTQAELESLLEEQDKDKLIDFMQELINNQLVKLAQAENVLYYQALSHEEAVKIKNMTPDEAMVYSYIEAAGREGIWTKTIRAKSNLHQHVVTRCLKSLEGQNYIKAVKSVKHPTRKIYMLYALQPSIELTGGPWFTEGELDSDFINTMLTLVWSFIADSTYPQAFQAPFAQMCYPPDYKDFPILEDVHSWIISNKVSTVDLGLADVRALCDVLVYDDKIELTPDGRYKATWSSIKAKHGVTSRGLEGVLDVPEMPPLSDTPSL
ncbi:DNA-directed RNA polymerase III subunit RPC6 [Wickerhamiella sorbophila]|uniref:DNA-directed RNA polymerase III subunit RPC6 n=1 Tax=Wickerhamiella sorbophila TaxID=45607 RepID=A0A2T0FKK1_9ASCO|nr:DNA-directed RNA polymerase III subunit RPC6 [Wickerhamiella sorbophila]PRT55502.1 DNA-directed RNA polymerase III subunit RPC6 [Wickerhamiella sorbophila]